jgi:hypothetical protein
MAYRLTAEPDFLRIELTGALTRADIAALTVELEAIEQASERIPNRLVNGIGLVERDLDVNDFLDLAARRKARTYKNPFKSALVAPTQLGRGFARMFQTLNDHPQIRIEVFETEREATLWLLG